MTNQNAFIQENAGKDIQVPGMVLRDNAGLPYSKQKIYKCSDILNFRMFPGDPSGSPDALFFLKFGGFSIWKIL